MSKRNNEHPGLRKEKISVIAASVFVLSALTLTGVYMSSQENIKTKDNKIDFAKLEQNQNTSQEEIIDTRFVSGKAKAKLMNEEENEAKSYVDTRFANEEMYDLSDNNDMDVDPQFTEAASGAVKNETQAGTDKAAVFMGEDNTLDTVTNEKTIAKPELSFTETDTLMIPVAGDVVMEYSMDKAIYHDTMQQYRYNPALVISATEGENITAAADGVVKSVYNDAQTGNTIVFELGNGYELTYGQLENITLKEGDTVSAGDMVGTVAKPTIYYTKEGTNIYIKLTKDGEPANPLTKAR